MHFCFPLSRPALGHTLPPIKWVPRVCSPEARQLGPEVDHTVPSRAKVKAEWSHISTPHIRLHGVDRYRLTFTCNIFLLMLQPMKVTYADPILHTLHEEHDIHKTNWEK